MKPSLDRPRMYFFILVAVWLFGLSWWWNNPGSIMHQSRYPGLPYGFLRVSHGVMEVQDFCYNLIFFRGIHDRVVAHPYRMEEQETLVRRLVPAMTNGMTHGYSPVAYVLALPLLEVTNGKANLIYDVLGSVGILLLLYFYLLQRVNNPVQLIALGLTALSVSLFLTLALGQSSFLTTTLLGFFWMLLQKRDGHAGRDLALGLIFWSLCLKPNIGLVPFILLITTCAWRPLIVGFFLLGLTWLCVGPLYGGWITGLQDYANLLNHYNNADFIPFMRRDYVPGHDGEIRALFIFDRFALVACSFVLLALNLTRRLSVSGLFQGLIAVFLLFSPYLLPSEDWILCLLVVENDFFREENPFIALAKLALLFAIMDLRGGLVVPWDFHFEFKCLFFAWMFGEQILRQRRAVTLRAA